MNKRRQYFFFFFLKRTLISVIPSIGARVLVGVDATKLSDRFSTDSDKFDKIIFNFPHAGGKMKINRNRELLKGFFISAQTLIKSTGLILVSLCNGQGGTPADTPQRRWDDSWQIVEMAAHGNFLLTNVEPFLVDKFPDYTCVGYRSLEKGFHNKDSLVHIFRKSDKPDSVNIALRNDLNLNFEHSFGPEDAIEWKKIVAKCCEKNNVHKSNVISMYPLSYEFDTTFSVGLDFSESRFYITLYSFAGNIIENVKFLGCYEFPESNKVTRTYRISYRSSSLPMYRSRVIDIHKNLVTRIIEDNLNIVVTK